jgi:hypothetical protein
MNKLLQAHLKDEILQRAAENKSAWRTPLVQVHHHFRNKHPVFPVSFHITLTE